MKSSIVILMSLAFIGLAKAASFSNATKDNPFVTCLTNPCLQVPGVGKIMGAKKESSVTGRNIYSYYQIPYGKPTSGNRRFAPPEPADELNDGDYRFDGCYTTYLLQWLNRVCPQAGVSLKDSYVRMMSEATHDMTDDEKAIMEENKEDLNTKAVAGNEDCLHLAVFTPRSPEQLEDNPNTKLPVMFFIHGGAFYMGTYFGMGPKNLLEHDVVLVEIQYRLGPLGFMCLDHPEAAGNMGLLDQALALDWVQKHISAFGGDPDQVTVFGESAGASSASYHMLSPISSNKFQRVIGQSGSALAGWAFDKQPDKHAKDIAARVGCPTDNLDNLVQCMKHEKSVDEIVEVHIKYIEEERYNGEMGFGGTSPCAQVAGDQIFIDKHPEDYLVSGDFDPKPMLMGTNKQEGSFVLGVMYKNYINPHGLVHNASYLTNTFIPVMLNALGLDDSSGVIFEIVENDYFNYTDLGDWDKMMPGMINLVGTFFLKAATYEFMKYNSIHGGESYFYSFEYEGQNSVFNLLFSGETPPLPHGVTHGDDLIYLFSTGLFTLDEKDKQISQELSSIWTNFAINGKMTSPRLGEIPQWTQQHPYYLKIDQEEKLLFDFIKTWNNPDRNPTCAELEP